MNSNRNQNHTHTEYFGNSIVGVVEYDQDPINPREDCCNIATLACWHRKYNLGDSGAGGWERGARDTHYDEFDFKKALLKEVGVSTDLVTDEECVDEAGCYDSGAHDALWLPRAGDLIAQHVVVVPLYLYDHSGISISTRSFGCSWDSGQVGYGYITLKKACEEKGLPWGVKTSDPLTWDTLIPKFKWDSATCKRVHEGNQTLREWAEKTIDSEVETYNAYLTGDAHCYVVYSFEDAVARGTIDEEDLQDAAENRLDFSDAEVVDSCGGYLGCEDYCTSEMRDAAKAHAQKSHEQDQLVFGTPDTLKPGLTD